MEAPDMKPTVIVAVLLSAFGVAQAAEVSMTRDAQGRPVYTDRPESLPAQRLDIKSNSTDTVQVQQRVATEQKGWAEADKAHAEAQKKETAEKAASAANDVDRAQRCREARDRYLNMMNAQRLYEPGEKDGERHYLTDAEIDAARENAKKVMDEFCSEP
jgi:hypothetical protein